MEKNNEHIKHGFHAKAKDYLNPRSYCAKKTFNNGIYIQR